MIAVLTPRDGPCGQYLCPPTIVRKYIGMLGGNERIARCGTGHTIDAMSRFGSQYHVSRPTGQCAHSGEPLPPGSACIATLCEREGEEGFERIDFSISSWESGARPSGLFSYWRTVVPAEDERKQMLVDDDVLLDLFDRLGEDERPQRVAFRFVLGLILMRKKHLKLVGRKNAEGGRPERWLLHRRGSDEHVPPIELVNPDLAEGDVRDITDQLSEVLNSDL